MKQPQPGYLRIISLVVLVIIGVFFFWHLIEHFRIPYILESPLVPGTIVDHILRDNLIITIIFGIAFFVSLLFYKKQRYIIVLVVCILSFVLVTYFPDLFIPVHTAQ